MHQRRMKGTGDFEPDDTARACFLERGLGKCQGFRGSGDDGLERAVIIRSKQMTSSEKTFARVQAAFDRLIDRFDDFIDPLGSKAQHSGPFREPRIPRPRRRSCRQRPA